MRIMLYDVLLYTLLLFVHIWLTYLAGLLWNFHSIFESFPIHTGNHCGPRIFEFARSAYDGASLRRCICGDGVCGLVGRPLQQVSLRLSRQDV